MATDVIVHVGYGKTATTWMQEEIFNSLGAEIYLGKREAEFPSWLLRLNYLDDFAFDADKIALKQEIRNLISDRQKVIISSEAFTNFGVIYQQANRIKYVLDDPKIIVVLRNPISWLISNYKYCVEYEGFHLPLESYLDFGEKRSPFSLEKRKPFYLPDLYFDEVIGRYQNLFGKRKVLVMRYEDFVSSPTSFGSVLSDFIGIDFPDFSTKAELTYLASKSTAEIEIRRLENLRTYVEQVGHTLKESDSSCIKTDVLQESVKERLRDHFAKHCVEHYPELLRP